MSAEEAKRLDHFFCENCSSESQKKLQNPHNTRQSDAKVFPITVVLNVWQVGKHVKLRQTSQKSF
jgi:hypothetical protein